MPSGLFESWLQGPFHLAALIPTFQLSGPYSCPIATLSLSQTPHLTDSPGRPQPPSRTGLPSLFTHFISCRQGHESTSKAAKGHESPFRICFTQSGTDTIYKVTLNSNGTEIQFSYPQIKRSRHRLDHLQNKYESTKGTRTGAADTGDMG